MAVASDCGGFRARLQDMVEDPLPISALQHWSYCPRQCGLILLEQAFEENVHTLRGRAVHATVDSPGFESRAGVRVERALPIACESLGLVGKADIVEFELDGTPYPVEYKYGRLVKAQWGHDALQLGGQALCLEEMTGKVVREGAIFYASSKRRFVVAIDDRLREQVRQGVEAIRAMLAAETLPPPVNDARCRACSLVDICQPQALAARDTQAAIRGTLFDPQA